MILIICATGTIQCVYTEALDLDEFGQSDIHRASNVEPEPDGWFAQIAGGPKLGPFKKRSEAISAEVEWIEDAMANQEHPNG